MRIIYGVGPAGFLTTRSLIQLANDEEENFPKASEVVLEVFLCGCIYRCRHSHGGSEALINYTRAAVPRRLQVAQTVCTIQLSMKEYRWKIARSS